MKEKTDLQSVLFCEPHEWSNLPSRVLYYIQKMLLESIYLSKNSYYYLLICDFHQSQHRPPSLPYNKAAAPAKSSNENHENPDRKKKINNE
jgi:hypothetical protein